MTKRFTIFVFLLLSLINFLLPEAYATEDPKSSPNNKVGVHILFPSELEDAAKLINSNGGDWGYVTIPIQAGDRDLDKWQEFMDNAKKLHIIPVIRLSTEGDYFANNIWRKPNFADVLDFANFFNSLDWPTVNRYIVIFNEPNRNDEWGGEANATEYAQILTYAVESFKFKNNNFFIISAGLDNASENNEYVFMQEVHNAAPIVFSRIDGLGSHSYPNPGFEQPPWVLTRKSISSFIYEKRLADLLAGKKLPVFITETGWSSNSVTRPLIGQYFTEAFASVWADSNVIVVTPFLLNAGTEPFAQFSLTTSNGDKNEIYNSIKNIAKVKGSPQLSNLKDDRNRSSNEIILPVKDFSYFKEADNTALKEKVDTAVELIRWVLRV